MPTSISRLLEEVSREHFPYPPATLAEVEAFEHRVEWRLDPDLSAFYLHCNGAELIERLPESPYQVLPLGEIVRARVAIHGADERGLAPSDVPRSHRPFIFGVPRAGAAYPAQPLLAGRVAPTPSTRPRRRPRT